MEIIGKTSDGYIVKMLTDEIIKAAGYSSSYDDGWNAAISAAGSRDRYCPPIGMKINVNAAYDFHSRIAAHEDAAKKAAGTLRALADLMDGARPSVVIPLAPPVAPANPDGE